MFKILILLLLIPQAPKTTDYELAKIMTTLSDQQRTILYQYGTIYTYSDTATANRYWNEHHTGLNQLTKEQANILSADLLANTELVYNIKQPSRLQSLMGIFTASRLLMGAAALIAAGALLMLLKRFWYRIYDMAMKYLAPVFRLLFSPRLLRIQLLLLSIIAIFLGPEINDLMFRTIVLQLGLVLLWTQLTALTTSRSFHKLYEDIFSRHYIDFSTKEILLQITMPSTLTLLAMGWLSSVCKDPWYPFEITAIALAIVYSLPPVKSALPIFRKLFLPFPTFCWKKDSVLASYIILTMIIWISLLFVPMVPTAAIVTVTLVLTSLLLAFSAHDFFIGKTGYKNYLWVQLITILWFCACVLTGNKLGIAFVTWSALAGLFLYVLLKYWELPTLFGWDWKHKRALGILGMALLIWLIAKLMNYFPELFISL
ncbi:hypothetical protein [Pedobacter caeni]|uniref:Uncharacterized protein n=1 Tax=Pedobacter caeni TaxID=288992 RepID=A0A1M5HG58_9SPHI|nr:hypothetical protein [Pedobacter caeni]SHG14959.1 hypothetical protein SAMN04488522_104650 [Pedobacter caeni]